MKNRIIANNENGKNICFDELRWENFEQMSDLGQKRSYMHLMKNESKIQFNEIFSQLKFSSNEKSNLFTARLTQGQGGLIVF